MPPRARSKLGNALPCSQRCSGRDSSMESGALVALTLFFSWEDGNSEGCAPGQPRSSWLSWAVIEVFLCHLILLLLRSRDCSCCSCPGDTCTGARCHLTWLQTPATAQLLSSTRDMLSLYLFIFSPSAGKFTSTQDW